MHHGGVLGMNDLAHLFAGGGHNIGVAVTSTGHTNPGGEVQVFLAVGCVDPATGRVVDNHGGCLLQDGAKCCHGFILS